MTKRSKRKPFILHVAQSLEVLTKKRFFVYPPCVLLYKLLVVHVFHPLVSVNSFRPRRRPAERPPVRPGLARIEHAQRLHIWVRMEALYSHMKSKNGRE